MGRTISIFIFRALAPAVILDGRVANHSSHQDAKRKVSPVLPGDTGTHARLLILFYFYSISNGGRCPPCVYSYAIPNIFLGTAQNIFCKTR